MFPLPAAALIAKAWQGRQSMPALRQQRTLISSPPIMCVAATTGALAQIEAAAGLCLPTLWAAARLLASLLRAYRIEASMALKVVGSGLGRTGTKSLQSALNILGIGPCHHMVEVFAHPQSAHLWIEAAAGCPDWDAIFAGYNSTVDYPGAHYWRQLAAYYPQAKVLHSVRDPDSWFESTQATIFAPNGPMSRPGPMTEFFASFTADFRDNLHDRAVMTDYFRRHTDEVKRTIPPERLLVYEVGQGWEPLCRFLQVPVPATPYPRENSRDAFIARVEGRAKAD
jgi:hypothetical protein